MYDSVLVATDGSDMTRSAIAHALNLAERTGATVHALYVVDVRALTFDDEDFTTNDGLLRTLRERGRRVTEALEAEATGRGLDAETAVVSGTPGREIREYATENDVSLVALGTRGRSGLARRMLGSVAESVVEGARQPVLTARSSVAPRGAEYDDVLLPTDGGDTTERVAEHAFDLADLYDGTVHALSVIDSSLINSPALLAGLERESEAALDAVERRGDDRGVDVVRRVWRGTPSECITEYAAQRDVDLIAMGSHKHRGLDRFLSTNVARRVVRTAPAPVITLRRRKNEAETEE